MEVLENTLDCPLDAFLSRPLFCFVAQRSGSGPRVSPLWFSWEAESLWQIAQLSGRSYPDRVVEDPNTAVAIVDFDPGTGTVEHVGMRGEASLEPYDESRADRLLRKYLGENENQWPDAFVGLDPEQYRLIRVDPETVVARDQSYTARRNP